MTPKNDESARDSLAANRAQTTDAAAKAYSSVADDTTPSRSGQASKIGDMAVYYARQGWHVVPLHTPSHPRPGVVCSCGKADCESPGKHPRTQHGVTDATDDVAQVEKWWAMWPEANIGLHCGASGIVAIDIDSYKPEFGDLDLTAKDRQTVTSLTGGGGEHLLYAHPAGGKIGNSNAKLGDAIDVRAWGGYIVLPPSLHASGKKYAWEEGFAPWKVKAQPIPDSLRPLLQELGARRTGEARTVDAAKLPTEARRARASLRRLNSDRCCDYNEWLRVGMALSELEDTGLDLWDEWSAGCEEKYVEGACEVKWSTFTAGDGLTLASLHRWADDDDPAGKTERLAKKTQVAAAPGPAIESFDIPELPEAATPDFARGDDAGEWLDLYVNYAAQVSPMTPKLFHEGAAIALASMAIGRRLKASLSFGDVFPNVFIFWLAQTTLWRKTTGLNIARDIARDVFPHLLAAQDTTPEGFLSDLAGREPAQFDSLTDDQKDLWRAERNFAAQRGWILDEMSGLLANAGKDYNAGLIEALLRFYDCDPKYTRSTRGQGRVIVSNAYLTMLGASTPAALAQHMASERLWAMGWWPRFALLAPDLDRPEWQVEVEEVRKPARLAGDLRRLYDRLPAPVWPDAPEARTVILGSVLGANGVFEAWQAYAKAVGYDLLTPDLDRRLWGTYGRLPIQAMKVAIILAALDWPGGDVPVVEYGHMAKAIRIIEGWRQSAHRALALTTESEFDKMQQRILRQIARFEPEGASLRDLYKAMKDKTPTDIEYAIGQLAQLGEVTIKDRVVGPKGGRPTTRYTIAKA